MYVVLSFQILRLEVRTRRILSGHRPQEVRRRVVREPGMQMPTCGWTKFILDLSLVRRSGGYSPLSKEEVSVFEV